MPAQNVIEILPKMDSNSLTECIDHSRSELMTSIQGLEAAAVLVPVLDSANETDRGILVAGFEAILYQLAQKLRELHELMGKGHYRA